jgi:hypothetical protein
MRLIGHTYTLNRMTGWNKRHPLFQKLSRRILQLLLAAGSVYLAVPFIYAAAYTWGLLHPRCEFYAIPDIPAKAITWQDAGGHSSTFWYIAPQNGRVLLLVGGHNGNLDNWRAEVNTFYQHGFGFIILPDPSCDDLPASLGYKEQKSVLAAVDFIHTQPEVSWLGAMGFSSGAAALLLAAPLIPDLRAMALMGNYADLRSEILSTPYLAGSLGWLGQHSVLLWYRLISGVTAAEVRPVDAYAELPPLKLLLIHAQDEAQRTQAQMQWQQAQLGNGVQADLWLVEGAYHGNYHEAAGEEYLFRLEELFLP